MSGADTACADNLCLCLVWPAYLEIASLPVIGQGIGRFIDEH